LFFSPTRLFVDIPRNRTWWLPFLLTLTASYTLTFCAANKIGFTQLTTNAVLSDPATAARLEPMSQEQKDSFMSTAEIMFKIGAFSAPLFILLYNTVYALALWFGLNLATGRSAEFGAIFTVLLYADLIQALRGMLATGALYLMPDPSHYNLQNPIGSNAGFFLGGAAPAWLRPVLEMVDGFTIWYLALIAIGCAVVSKVKRQSAFAVVFGLWAMIMVCRVIWVSIA
jgi:hypothetical protein